MVTYQEHNKKIKQAASEYHARAKQDEERTSVNGRFSKIEKMAMIIGEDTKNRQGEIKDLKAPILSKQSLREKLKECGIASGLSDSSLMPDIRLLECYTGVRYILADSGAKRGSLEHAGKYG